MGATGRGTPAAPPATPPPTPVRPGRPSPGQTTGDCPLRRLRPEIVNSVQLELECKNCTTFKLERTVTSPTVPTVHLTAKP